jgi:hypothetical protein
MLTSQMSTQLIRFGFAEEVLCQAVLVKLQVGASWPPMVG